MIDSLLKCAFADIVGTTMTLTTITFSSLWKSFVRVDGIEEADSRMPSQQNRRDLLSQMPSQLGHESHLTVYLDSRDNNGNACIC